MCIRDRSNPSVALIDYRLGVIALAVEENSAAQEALDKCAVRCHTVEQYR